MLATHQRIRLFIWLLLSFIYNIDKINVKNGLAERIACLTLNQMSLDSTYTLPRLFILFLLNVYLIKK